MTLPYSHFSDLAQGVQPPDKGILSRTLYNDDRFKVVLVGIANGEELSLARIVGRLPTAATLIGRQLDLVAVPVSGRAGPARRSSASNSR
jgi:hypothetical protein